jgi:hypothetical protein
VIAEHPRRARPCDGQNGNYEFKEVHGYAFPRISMDVPGVQKNIYACFRRFGWLFT